MVESVLATLLADRPLAGASPKQNEISEEPAAKAPAASDHCGSEDELAERRWRGGGAARASALLLRILLVVVTAAVPPSASRRHPGEREHQRAPRQPPVLASDARTRARVGDDSEQGEQSAAPLRRAGEAPRRRRDRRVVGRGGEASPLGPLRL